jgi:hypothetical protein
MEAKIDPQLSQKMHAVSSRMLDRKMAGTYGMFSHLSTQQ